MNQPTLVLKLFKAYFRPFSEPSHAGAQARLSHRVSADRASGTRLPRRCWRSAAEERVLSARSVSTAIQLGDLSGKVLRTRRLESRGALALSSTAESVWPSDSRFLMAATFLIYYLKTSWIVWLSFEGNLGHADRNGRASCKRVDLAFL